MAKKRKGKKPEQLKGTRNAVVLAMFTLSGAGAHKDSRYGRAKRRLNRIEERIAKLEAN
jgi:hypothetical protein